MFQDFTKLECPFVRKTYQVNKEHWEAHGSKLQLRSPEVYLVTPQINPGYEWVLEHPDTFACEKLDGTNVGLRTEKGRLMEVQNRANPIDLLQVMRGPTFIIEGIFNAIAKGYVKETGLQFGELIGPKLQGNPLRLKNHIWYPFTKARQHLRYNSFNLHPKDFWSWSEWFRLGLHSRFMQKSKELEGEADFAEGLVFTNDTIGIPDHPRMAKLRRSMYPWFYWDKIEIYDIEPQWRNTPPVGA